MSIKHLILLLLLGISFCFSENIFAQSCSKESITAKYWQYRDNLKHFVAVDRDPSGCIGDGIGQDGADPCSCSKAGYSLPATSIDQRADGSKGMGDDRNNGQSPWYDPACANDPDPPGTHWDPNAPKVHNSLAMSSETPHQMGWYWVTLATEYKLLTDNGQNAEAQRTLEELFLGLQAYKRLDITANCLARDRYEEIENDFETDDDCAANVLGTGWQPGPHKSCLCDFKYRFGGGGCEKKNFDSPCRGNNLCQFVPQTDGYSGFFIREDANQNLEKILHDDSEDKWNIDVVNSPHAFSLRPPCETKFSPACYNVKTQNYMSQDGVFGLMLGLAMIKRYIPPTATVTTCDDVSHNVLDIAVRIATAMTNRIDDAYQDRISWPRSGFSDCCNREVFFSNCEGGRVIAEMHGLKKACSYIDGAERHSSVDEAIAWGGLAYVAAQFGANTNFWVRLKTLGWDMGGAGSASNYQTLTAASGLEIMPMINNLLYPAAPNMGRDKNYFKAMLCDAPCGGACKKKSNFPETTDEPDFDCPNTPNWVGQRWESHSPNSDDNRQFNGLDFMALYNIYLLCFPEEQTAYFNPDRPQGNIMLNSGFIGGPNVLCQGNTATYTLLSNAPNVVQGLTWATSANLEVLNSANLEANIKANANSSVPGFVQASFKENQVRQQYFDGQPASGKSVIDVCEFNYSKPVSTGLPPNYNITTEFNHCSHSYTFHAVPSSTELPGTTYAWSIEAHSTSGQTVSVSLTGRDAYTTTTFPGSNGHVVAKLAVHTSCGEAGNISYGIPYGCGQFMVTPNPANREGQVNIYLNQDKDYVVGERGIEIKFIRSGSGTIQKTERIYQNGQSVSIASFPKGNYTVQAILEDKSVLTTTLIVSEK